MRDREFLQDNRKPEWKEYARKACELRMRHADVLLKGTYSCESALTRANPGLEHGLFTNGSERCLVLWNDTDADKPFVLPDGYRFTRWETPTAQGEGVPGTVPANSILVLV